jgi:hypothetical protein
MSRENNNLPSYRDFIENPDDLPSLGDFKEENLPSVDDFYQKPVEEETQTIENSDGKSFVELTDVVQVPEWSELVRLVNDVRKDIPKIPEIKYYDEQLEEICAQIEQIQGNYAKTDKIDVLSVQNEEFEGKLSEIESKIPTVKYYDHDINSIYDKITDIKEELKCLPEVKYYEEDLESLKSRIEQVSESIPTVPDWFSESEETPDFSWIAKSFSLIDDDIDKVECHINIIKEKIKFEVRELNEIVEKKDFELKVDLKNLYEHLTEDFNKTNKNLKETKDKLLEEVKGVSRRIWEQHHTSKDDDRKLKKSLISEQNKLKQSLQDEIKKINEQSVRADDSIVKFITDLKETIDTLPEVKYYDDDISNLRKEFNEEIKTTKGDIQTLVGELHKIASVIKKQQKTITEGYLLNEPPEQKQTAGGQTDPLTPEDQQFATLKDLSTHYRLFINRIQTQMSTMGGGGETRLKYLDDVVGIATNASTYDGKFLKYDHSVGKFEFDTPPASPAVGIGEEGIVYVAKNGDDSNAGTLTEPKLTIKAAVDSVASSGLTDMLIRVAPGSYVENNPIILPEQTTLQGDSLREVSVIPLNIDKDLIYVANGNFVENMSFTGTMNEGKAIISFNPNKPSYVTQGPYIRNCTNFVTNSIGMKIDGSHVIGDTRAMNVDSYTQLNQGGIGVSISNEGYAQLVSIFTIYNDQSIVCNSGGQCDLTNSNSSFGRLGLVADGIGPTNFIGTVSEFTSAGSNVFPIDLSVETVSISAADYDAVSGLTTITTHKAHGYTKGMSVELAGLGFTCPAYPHTFSSGVTDAITNTGVSNRFSATSGTTYDPATGILVLNIGSGHGQTAYSEFTATTGTAYNPSTGILTVVTTGVHGMTTGDYVKIVEGSLRFTCAKDGNATNHDYPRATDPVNNKWKQVVVTNTTTFTMNIGKSSDTSIHTWVSAVANSILRANSLISIVDGGVTFTCAKDSNATNHSYPRSTDPASGKIFGVEAIDTATITLNIGKSSDTSVHTFVSGVTNAVVARTKAASYTAVVGTTYDGPTGSLVLDVNTSHGLTAATALTAGSGTTYEPTTGLLTVVTTGAHGMTTGDLVKFDKQSLTFTCTSDGNTAQIAYPRTTDPVFNKWKQVIVTNSTTFTVFIGATITGNYVHTWVSATAGGVKKAESLITLTDNSVSFTCTKDGNTVVKSYPAYTDPASCRILGVDAVTSDTITINVGPANLATFPDNFGRVFTVKQVNSTTQYETYVGFSTIIHGYDSGGNTNVYVTRPFDGQVVYFDNIYNTIDGVTITDGGSGYTQPPQITFSDPSESWGIKATGNAEITDGRVTGVTMISNGRGYTGTPTVTIAGAATGTPDILPTYYVVSSSTPISQGISTVTFTDNLPYAVGVGTTVPFFKQSRVLASSQAFEYIGSGNTALSALPQRGGVAIPENEIVNKNGGLVIFTSTDQAGNFKIGKGVIINQLEGSITGDAYNRSLFANITPYILALGGDS